MIYTIALFGEAERGQFRTGYLCKNLEELSKYLGEPPSKECQGLTFAVQALLFKQNVLFFRVHEEGFSIQDYLSGLNHLTKKELFPDIAALCLPGVGNAEIINATATVCDLYKSFLIFTEKDLYDYLTYKAP
jgi:hypothetical protein